MTPEFILDLKTVILTAVIAWGVTEIFKPLIKKGPTRKSVIRALALIVGVLVGRYIYPELGGQGGNVVGGALGGASGVLNALVVAQVKNKIKNQGGGGDG